MTIAVVLMLVSDDGKMLLAGDNNPPYLSANLVLPCVPLTPWEVELSKGPLRP